MGILGSHDVNASINIFNKRNNKSEITSSREALEPKGRSTGIKIKMLSKRTRRRILICEISKELVPPLALSQSLLSLFPL